MKTFTLLLKRSLFISLFFVSFHFNARTVVSTDDFESAGSELIYGGTIGSLFFPTSSAELDVEANPEAVPMQRVRLRFYTPEGGSRPLLLAFEPNNMASDGVDYGYDALCFDTLPSDLLWMIDGAGYVIQGVGAFDTAKQYPFALNMAIAGQISIALTDLENFDDTIDVYVYDSLLGTHHHINTAPLNLTLGAGNHDNRFILTFTAGDTLTINEKEVSDVTVKYLLGTEEIYIKQLTNVQVKQVFLVNSVGQTVKVWDSTDMAMSNEIRIPTNNIYEGTYFIKVETDGAPIHKKIVIK